MMSSALRTLDLPELVEVVLLHLNSFDLLIACKGCRTWRDIIEGSAAIADQLANTPTYFPKSVNNGSDSDWHFSAHCNAVGRLFILRSPRMNLESFVLFRYSDRHLLVIDGRYAIRVHNRNQSFTVFPRKGGTVVCRTRSFGVTGGMPRAFLKYFNDFIRL